ncbi:hypothetical protein WKV44_05195 [Spirochaetia bacterium 38H-sp]|uniref:Uncharacterized protein n=1 Tax=Rarispira pelagica TaxID=3141764 RepID=A0ABU9UB96_9SPIR
MEHPVLIDFEKRLKAVFDRIDTELEDRYGRLFPRHPSRPARGETCDSSQDGLFGVGASFSAGFGSDFGRGYVLELRIATLSHVDGDLREKIVSEAVERLQALLVQEFPERKLKVVKDGEVYKIVGDLSLS